MSKLKLGAIADDYTVRIAAITVSSSSTLSFRWGAEPPDPNHTLPHNTRRPTMSFPINNLSAIRK